MDGSAQREVVGSVKPEILVDFNDIDDDFHTTTLLKFAVAPDSVVPGKELIAGDDEGNCCRSRVLKVEGVIVTLFLDLKKSTSSSADQLVATQ